MEIDAKDFILRIFKVNSFLDEMSLSNIKDFLKSSIKDYDLPSDLFDPYLQSLPEKRYSIGEIASHLSLPIKELLKNLTCSQKIIEGCFAENNLKNNLKLRNLIQEASDGYIPLSTFLKYKNVKSLTSSEIFLSKSIELSSLLEISADRHYVRLQASYKPQDQDLQVFYYNLDTSQTQVSYSSIAEGLPLKPTILSRTKKITLLAGNSRIICYFKPDIVKRLDLATGEDKVIGQAKGLTYIEIKTDEDLLVGIIDKNKIFVVNLQNSQQVFEYRVTDSQVEKVIFHPTEKNLLARFFFNEAVLFNYTPGKNNELAWFKVVPLRQKILNIALVSNLLAAAVGQGQILVINIDTDATIASYSPHTYNTMMYSSNITLHFITPSFLLTTGRSQNEFCLTKIDTKEKSHVLTIQSLSRKHISVNGEYILVTDPLTSNVSIVAITDCEGMLKFSKVIDYRLDCACTLALLNSVSSFVVATKIDCRTYQTNIEVKQEVQCVGENSMESAEIVNAISLVLGNRIKLVNAKVGEFTKLNGLKKGLQESVTENIEKTVAKDQKALQEEIKKNVSEGICSGFRGAFEEMMQQVVGCTESGIKEFTDKESELDSVFDVLAKENFSKITSIIDFTDIYSKICMRKLKKLEKVEEAFREKKLTLKNRETSGIQEKINILLAQGDYETALIMIVKYPSKLYAALNVINPYGLLSSKKISSSLHNKILKQFLIFPPTSKQLINSAEWLECLLKMKTWNNQ